MAGKSTYVALLRGINVSGHKIVKMEQLRAAFATLGFADAKTYIQSGNVVFKAPTQANQKLAKKIEEKVLLEFGFPVPVIVKTVEELTAAIENNPFANEKGIDPSRLHVTFLSQALEKNAQKMLNAIPAGPDRFSCSGENIYLHCPNGYGESKLSNSAFEKILSVKATTRNWNTVNRLLEKMRG